MSKPTVPSNLSVDMTRCAGHGICAWLLPERIGLDRWGYADVDGATIETSREKRRARRAARACPRSALRLVDSPIPQPGPTVSS